MTDDDTDHEPEHDIDTNELLLQMRAGETAAMTIKQQTKWRVQWEMLKLFIGSVVRTVLQTISNGLHGLYEWLDTQITWPRIKKASATTALILGPAGLLYLSYQLAGPLDTIVYAILFSLCFGLAPILIGILGQTAPMSGSLGKSHFVLGQMAAGAGWLVQLEDRWEMCPGDSEKFWLDGDWYEVDEGRTNLTVLGWKPFGITWCKTKDALNEARVDPSAIADGGVQEVTRGGVQAATPDYDHDFQCSACEESVEIGDQFCANCGNVIDIESVTDAATSSSIQAFESDSWLVALNRLYRTGLAQIGNTDLIETAEEQTMLDEVGTGTVSEWSTVIGGIIGVTLGVVAGYVMLGGL